MKKLQLLLSALLMLGSANTLLAKQAYQDDVNTFCAAYLTSPSTCETCHTVNYGDPTVEKDLYLAEGACGFCPENPECAIAPPPTEPLTEAELIAKGQSVTNEYFATLFRLFGQHVQQTAAETGLNPATDSAVFTAVFPQCPDIAPLAGSEMSKKYGYLVRRVTTKTRNSRNIPDEWELDQLKYFEALAAKSATRTEFPVTDPVTGAVLNKPNGQPLITNEYEVYDYVKERGGKGKSRVANTYFRYMRSVTMPPLSSGLPCLRCHGNTADLAADYIDSTGATTSLVDAVGAEYPYDDAMGYSAGEIRGAWTIKIPVDVTP